MVQQIQGDNTAMGVILGILVAVVLVAGAYFFMKQEGVIGSTTNTTNIEIPANTSPAAGEPSTPDTAPSVAPSTAPTDGGVAP